jgi:hypothetical protein
LEMSALSASLSAISDLFTAPPCGSTFGTVYLVTFE